MEGMKIGITATYWDPDLRFQGAIFGAKVAGVEFLKALFKYVQQIETIDVFVSPPSQAVWISFREGLRQQGIPVHRFVLRPAVELPKAIRNETFSAFHCTPPPDWGNLLLLRQFAKEPFICTATMHGISYAFLIPFLATSLLHGVTEGDKLICSSNAQRIALLRLLSFASQALPQKMELAKLEQITTLIPLGIDPNRFLSMDKELARRQWQLPLDGLIILYIGRLTITKTDFLPLFRAFREVLKAFPSCWLVLAGQEYPPGLTQQLARYADELGVKDYIIMLTSIPESAKPSLYNAADIFVSLSHTPEESFGIALLEAMACGLPVVATDWDGYREIIIDGETGYLVPTWWGKCDDDFNLLALMGAWETDHFYLTQSVAFSVDSLVEMLSSLLQDAEKRREMGKKGRERIEKMFCWEAIIPNYEQLWLQRNKLPPDLIIPPNDFSLPRFWQTFSHYPTYEIAPTMKVLLTPLGYSLAEGHDVLLIYDELRFFLDEDLLDFLLETVYSTSTKTIEELLCDARQQNPSWSSSFITYHLLWLTKQGFLTFAF
jgi:glycosyltransferase involved in cell wall biosynthesis